MKKSLTIQCALMVLFTLVLLWTVPATAADAVKETVKTVYVCGCGPEAKCDTVSDQPGKSPCGKPLIEKQVLKEDADKIYVCACPEGCKCGLNQADPTKCACGKELRAYPKAAAVKGACPHAAPASADCAKKCDSCPKHADCGGCPNNPAAAK